MARRPNQRSIASDDWSWRVLCNEVAEAYDAVLARRKAELPELPIQYADFAIWQRQQLRSEVLATHLEYWQQQLANLPLLELPYDYPRPALETFRGAYCHLRLPLELTERLKTLSQEAGATLFMTLLTAFAALIARYSGQSDLAVGTPIANRTHRELEGLIGFFVNTLVLRCDLSGNPTFLQALDRMREVTLEAYTHQDLPFERLVEELQPERDASRTPLVQAMVVLQNTMVRPRDVEAVRITEQDLPRPSARFDLVLEFSGKMVQAVQFSKQ